MLRLVCKFRLLIVSTKVSCLKLTCFFLLRLFYDTFMRVIISSANFVDYDWHSIDNGKRKKKSPRKENFPLTSLSLFFSQLSSFKIFLSYHPKFQHQSIQQIIQLIPNYSLSLSLSSLKI